MEKSALSIRPIRDDDDLDELHEGDNEWAGSALARNMSASAGDAMVAFHVAEQDGRLVGYFDSFLPQEDNPTGVGFASVWVLPEARGRGVGAALLEALLPLATARGARRLTARVDSEDESSLRWIRAKGATTGGTHLESTLELTDDLPLLPPPDGVAVVVMPDSADEIAWRSAHEANVRLMRDTPDAETNPAPMPYEIYRALLAESWQLCLARTDDGSIVGLTCVFPKNEKLRQVNTMLTGVNREWRGRGLATALKTAHAIALRDAGWRAIVTQNMDGNDHILAANKRLGFRPSKALLDVLYDLPESIEAG
ncbi:MAG TPA: GNAT family N-acetyltransferase [Galbitalea sp.]|jgi:GNAT superfamily N-acetyltransferase|nr:GNAT family N-acetyltransferase [Galbitalea sp.]